MNKDKGFRLAAATGLHKGDRDYQQDQLGLFAHPRVPGCVLGVVADGVQQVGLAQSGRAGAPAGARRLTRSS